jgi:hypothetical protein
MIEALVSETVLSSQSSLDMSQPSSESTFRKNMRERICFHHRLNVSPRVIERLRPLWIEVRIFVTDLEGSAKAVEVV